MFCEISIYVFQFLVEYKYFMFQVAQNLRQKRLKILKG